MKILAVVKAQQPVFVYGTGYSAVRMIKLIDSGPPFSRAPVNNVAYLGLLLAFKARRRHFSARHLSCFISDTINTSLAYRQPFPNPTYSDIINISFLYRHTYKTHRAFTFEFQASNYVVLYVFLALKNKTDLQTPTEVSGEIPRFNLS